MTILTASRRAGAVGSDETRAGQRDIPQKKAAVELTGGLNTLLQPWLDRRTDTPAVVRRTNRTSADGGGAGGGAVGSTGDVGGGGTGHAQSVVPGHTRDGVHSFLAEKSLIRGIPDKVRVVIRRGGRQEQVQTRCGWRDTSAEGRGGEGRMHDQASIWIEEKEEDRCEGE